MKNLKINLPPMSNPDVHEAMRALLELAIELYGPESILIFGSQAVGNWRPDSDFDLLILEPGIKQTAGIMHVEAYKRKIRLKFDAVVALNKTVNEHKEDKSSVYARALKEGFIAYQR